MRELIKIFSLLLTPSVYRFNQSLRNPQAAQQSIQNNIFQRFNRSAYGEALQVQKIENWSKIPIVAYEDIEPWITKKNALTSEPILFYEQTSGSSGPRKKIPYTQSLLRSFNHMFCVWAYDLIRHGPSFSTGKIYACISPKLGSAVIQDDAVYLDPWIKILLKPFLVGPERIQDIRDAEVFKYQLALALLQEEELEIISIWSPSFLQVLLQYSIENRQLLQAALQPKISQARLQLLATPEIEWTRVWPHLKLISCWDRVNASDQVTGLRAQFPNAWIQGKGLLATEAPLTIPSIEAGGYVPLLDEVFFEFEDSKGNIYLLHELNKDQEYSIILSQKGGLYRYRIGDRVSVSHWFYNTPCLEFLGRGAIVSDLVGEKLNEVFIQKILQDLLPEGTQFRCLAPATHPLHYLLLLDQITQPPKQLALQLDSALSQSYHYHQARLLGQLGPPEILVSVHIPEIMALHRASSGSAWAGIKHPLLMVLPLNSNLLQELRCSSVNSYYKG